MPDNHTNRILSDREKAGLRGPVKTCVDEIILPDGSKYLTTTEYSADGRLLRFSTNSHGSEWIRTQTYDADGHLVKITSGKVGEPSVESLHTYDESGRLLTITNSPQKDGRIDFRYDEQGRQTAMQSFDPKTLQRAQNTASALSPWDTAGLGIGVPMGGNLITLYDENDRAIEAQVREAQGTIVSRVVRSYDAKGRMVEEKPIWENPILMMLEKVPDEQRVQLSTEQIKQVNEQMSAVLGGKEQAGIS